MAQGKELFVPNRLYLDTVFGDAEGNELVAFLWFQGRIGKKLLRDDLEITEEFDPKRNADVAEVLRSLLEGRSPIKRYNIDYDEFVRKYIIISRSPPKGKRIAEVMKDSHVMIGTFIGLGAAKEFGSATFAFVTVPTGILIIGLAKTITDELRRALSKRIREWFKD